MAANRVSAMIVQISTHQLFRTSKPVGVVATIFSSPWRPGSVRSVGVLHVCIASKSINNCSGIRILVGPSCVALVAVFRSSFLPTPQSSLKLLLQNWWCKYGYEAEMMFIKGLVPRRGMGSFRSSIQIHNLPFCDRVA